MRFLIAGACAVGGFVGARLADAGQDVTVLVRPHAPICGAGRLLNVCVLDIPCSPHG